MNKIAEALGVMPNSASVRDPRKTPPPSTKTADLRVMKPEVEMVEPEVQVKQASVTALPGRFPLDDYRQIKTASRYFDSNCVDMTVQERREFCLNMVKAASSVGIEVSHLAASYGSEEFAEPTHIKLGFASRHAYLGEHAVERHILDGLEGITLRKEASLEACREALAGFDRDHNLDLHYGGSGILDPYLTFHGGEPGSFRKVAEPVVQVGSSEVGLSQLMGCLEKGATKIAEKYGSDFVEAMQKDPIQVFGSMPDPEKRDILSLGT